MLEREVTLVDLVNPWGELDRLRQEMGRWWWPVPAEAFGRGWWPSVDVRETDDEIVVSAEVPGVDPDHLELSISERGLVLEGETRAVRDADEAGYRVRERRHGRFRRAIAFPAEVQSERARASYNDGLLEVRVPKADTGRRVRRLPIERGPGQPPQ